jgi:putative transposase
MRFLEQLVELHGRPAIVKSDTGPEFVAKKVQDWIQGRSMDVHFIEPGSPWQNGHRESFNGVFPKRSLNCIRDQRRRRASGSMFWGKSGASWFGASMAGSTSKTGLR